ncbi:hypothetical protein MNBD_GAMMA09-2447 [hydrothermal vent metagenome]|uniref:Uncharacterized protein n=1 Tax=hydrothermal vent metagenome TaxID=652676 RepID=A0A3B0Y5U8_9ZZZZ
MPISRIIFFPAAADQSIENSLIIATLIDIEFALPTIEKTHQHLPGERFLSLLTFLGCSPNINLSPTEGENYCAISLLKPTDCTVCLGFTQNSQPKCPNCKKRIANWKTADWQQKKHTCKCDKCMTYTAYAELNWKHECGFGRCGFEISHIYPHEAVPTEQLLNALHQSTGSQWQYCYANN